MKTLLRNNYLLIAIAVFLMAGSNKAKAQDAPPVSGSITYQTFYDELSPYGTWIDYPGYGHVWNPAVEGDFRPYATNGNWVYSDEGWAWASDYSWGWAPFHYGRWLYDDTYGWLWVPGYDWSPAWVTWGSADNYYAWAPLMPEVNAGVQFTSWRPHSFYWNICDRSHIYDHDIAHQLINPAQAGSIVPHISIISNFNNTHVHNLFYASGPQINEVQKFTNRQISPVKLKEVQHINQVNHQDNQMSIYRPQVQQPQPRQFKRIDNASIKPIRTEEDRPVMQRNQQIENINRLPAHTAPVAAFGGGAGNRGNGGGRRH